MTDLVACKLPDRIAAAAPVSAYIPDRPCTSTTAVPTMAFHGVEDLLLPYEGGGNSGQIAFEDRGATTAERNGCAAEPTETQYVPTVEQIEYTKCDEPVVLYQRPRQRTHVAGSPARTASGGDDRFLLG